MSRAAPETMCVVSIGDLDDVLFAIPVQAAPAVMRALSGAVQLERNYGSLKYQEEFQIKREYLPLQIKRVKASAICRMTTSTTSTPPPGETP